MESSMLTQTTIKNDEMLDLVDDQDNVIGQELRSKIGEKCIKNVRVVNAFLINDKNELWIPKRSAHKKIFPSCLDFSVGGYVMAGESYQEAFKRETYEELNLDVSLLNYSLLFHLSPHQHNISSFMHVYRIKTNSVPDYNKNDFDTYYWMTIDEFKASIQNGVPVKNDLQPVLSHFELSLNT